MKTTLISFIKREAQARDGSRQTVDAQNLAAPNPPPRKSDPAWQRRMNLFQALTVMVAVLLWPLAPGLRAEANEIVVVADGASPYVVVVAEDAEQKKISEAAQLLQTLVERATGVELPMVKESEFADDTPAIFLGRTKAAREAGIPVEEITGWSYANRVIDGNLYLVGEDRPGNEKQVGFTGYSGTLKAVVSFLENHVGIRFVMPGPMGTHVPASDRLTVPADLDESWSPLFEYLVGRAIRLNLEGRDYEPYGIAHNYFGSRPGDDAVFKHYGSHSFPRMLPEEKYFEDHPEYFALLGGIRTGQGNHLCISNPDVQELLLAEVEKDYERGYQMVMLSPSDGYRECECPGCQAIHPDTAEKLWIIKRQWAEELHRRWPDRQVVFNSYQAAIKPPETFKTFPENVVISTNRYVPEYFEAWSKFDVPFGVYLPKWLGSYRPGSPRYTVELVRIFRDNNVIGIYIGGGLDGYTGNSWGLYAPRYYSFGKAMGDPDRDYDELEREYIDAAFGEAAGPMSDFFTTLHRRAEFLAKLDRRGEGFLDPTQRGYSFATKPSDMSAHIFAPKILNDMTSAMDRAWELAETEEVKARLEIVDVEFQWLRSLAIGNHLFRAYRAMPSWETLGVVEAHVEAHRELLKTLFPDGQTREPGGSGQLRPPFSGRVFGMPNQAPYNWDFDLLRSKELLPGVGMKRAEARRINAFEIDGRVDKPEWNGIPFEEIGEIALAPSPSETRFKIAYDEQNLYVAFEGKLTSPTALDGLTAVGRDGVAWQQENFELMLDPHGTRQTYYHFIINPLPNSSLERRFGYFDDPEHPYYEDFEWDWRGDWEYQAYLDRENQVWTAEVKIPFSTFDISPPQSGDLWTINIGRNEYPEGRGTVTYLWSPNLETKTFHARTAFGELVFE